MDDLISRQAVKELAHKQVREKYCGMALKEHRDFYIKLADSIIDLLPSAQPELIEKVAYIRGFEQGRTQGMIDAQGEQMSRLIDNTIKAEWTNADALDLQSTCNQLATDTISRQAAIDALEERLQANGYSNVTLVSELNRSIGYLKRLPSAQVELSEEDKRLLRKLRTFHNGAYAKVLDKLMAFIQTEQQWIPVNKKIPEEDVAVLVTDDAGGMTTVDVDRCGKYENRDERFWYYSQNVIAWMPLPEPYQEGER